MTLNSIESFTSNTLFCDPSARLYTDTSSLSSISTGTEFSASAVSLGDDYNAESREAVCDVDDGTFMEVSLHGRNSYEKARNRSLDSGFEDHGAKPKRKGFSGFLTRYVFASLIQEYHNWHYNVVVPYSVFKQLEDNNPSVLLCG